MQATIEIITNPIDVTQGTTETTQSMTFDISPSFIKGDDGITPHIGANGNWYIGTTDTNVKARATDGHTPTITATKNGTTTTIKSDGVAIATINDGEDGTSDYNELNNKPTFKTINSESIVGEGNIAIGGGGEPDTYIKSASVSGNTLTLTKKDNSTQTYTPTTPSWNDIKPSVGIALSDLESTLQTSISRADDIYNDYVSASNLV